MYTVHTGIFWGHLRTHFGVTCTHRYFLGSSAHTFWGHMYTQVFSGVICAHILGSHVHCTHRYFLGSSAHTFWGHMYTRVFSRVICAHILGSHVHTGIFWGHLRTHFGVTCTHRYFLGSAAHTFWGHMCTQVFSGVICAHILGSHVHTGIFWGHLRTHFGVTCTHRYFGVSGFRGGVIMTFVLLGHGMPQQVDSYASFFFGPLFSTRNEKGFLRGINE